MYMSLSVCRCVFQRISVTAGRIWFCFTVKLFIGPVKVYKYLYTPKRKRLLRKVTYQ